MHRAADARLPSPPAGKSPVAEEDSTQVFVSAPGKVVLAATCFACGAAGAAPQTYAGFLTNFSPSVAAVPGTTEILAADNDLESIK